MQATAPKRWEYRQFELPGSWGVKGHAGDVALLSHDLRDAESTRRLYLLDLRDGRRVLVRDRAVNRGLVISGAHLGDGWVAWEEVCTNDLERNPRSVVWSLYAARVSTDTLEVSATRLVASDTADMRSRPLFGIDGDSLFVGCTVPSRQGRAARGIVERFDLRRPGTRNVFRKLDRAIANVSVSDGSVVLVSRKGETKDDLSCGIQVVEASSGRPLLEYDPPAPGIVSHGPAFHDGWLAWAALRLGDGSNTDVLLRSPEGGLSAMTIRGGDACLAGDYALAEASEPNTESVETRSIAPAARVYAVKLGERSSALVLEGLIEKGFWWQIAAPAEYRGGRLVVYADGTKLNARKSTLVRVYGLPEARRTAE